MACVRMVVISPLQGSKYYRVPNPGLAPRAISFCPLGAPAPPLSRLKPIIQRQENLPPRPAPIGRYRQGHAPCKLRGLVSPMRGLLVLRMTVVMLLRLGLGLGQHGQGRGRKGRAFGGSHRHQTGQGRHDQNTNNCSRFHRTVSFKELIPWLPENGFIGTRQPSLAQRFPDPGQFNS